MFIVHEIFRHGRKLQHGCKGVLATSGRRQFTADRRSLSTSDRRSLSTSDRRWSTSDRRSLSTAERRGLSTPAVAPDVESAPAKPFSEMPGPKGLPILGNLLDIPKTIGQSHIAMQEAFAEFGPIYKVNLGVLDIVQLKDVDAVEALHRMDGRTPSRMMIGSWKEWREAHNLAKGIIIEDGEDWRRMRSLLDKRMLRPRHVATYTDNFNEVNTDFISRLEWLMSQNKSPAIPHLDKELFHWSLETIGTVLYETRFGGLRDDKDLEISAFIEAVHGVFQATEKVIYFPRWLAPIIVNKWHKLHEKSWKTIFSVGSKIIDKKIVEIGERSARGEEIDGFLSVLLANQNLSKDEVYANVTELMLGAVDTTSNTMQWVLYELSRNAEAQTRLQQEVFEATDGSTRLPTHHDILNMPFLKAIIKEVLRLYPVAGTVSRVVQEDIVLKGYMIPKGMNILCSLYSMGRDPEHFWKPDDFHPERWLRSEDNKKVHSFAWLPFGFGPRMCIGRRVAELEMHLLLARLIQKFDIQPANDTPLELRSYGLFVPDRSVEVKFIARKTA